MYINTMLFKKGVINMRYTLEVWLPKNNFWFKAFVGKDMIELGRQIIKVKKQGHKYRVSKVNK